VPNSTLILEHANILGETAGIECVVRKRFANRFDGRLNSNDSYRTAHMMRRKDRDSPHAEVFDPSPACTHPPVTSWPRPAALLGYDTIPSGRCRRSRSPAS